MRRKSLLIMLLAIVTMIWIGLFMSPAFAATEHFGDIITKEGPKVDVRAFGALKGGASDIGASVNRAIASATAGSTIIFPNGTYLINTQVVVNKNDIALDFGSSIILNTTSITETVWENQQISPIILVNADNVRIANGHFKNCVNQGIFAGGSVSTHKNGFIVENTIFTNLDNKFLGTWPAWSTGVNYVVGDRIVVGDVHYFCSVNHTSGMFATDLLTGYWAETTRETKAVQTRHVDNVTIRGVVAEVIGHARSNRYAGAISSNYGDNISIVDNTVDTVLEGGGGNLLYVNNGIVTGNKFLNISNSLGGQSNVGLHVKYSNYITVGNNQVTGTGMTLKLSDGSKGLVVQGNEFITTGTYVTNYYAGVYLEGAQDFIFEGNKLTCTAGRCVYLSPHTSGNAMRGKISNNDIRSNYDTINTVDMTPTTYGSAIQYNAGNLGTDRGLISFTGNRIHNGTIWMLQSTGTSVSGNQFYFDMNPYNITETAIVSTAMTTPGGAAIWDQSGSYNTIAGNDILYNVAAGSDNRVGIRASNTTYSTFANNTVRFSDSTKAYGTLSDAATTGTSWDGNYEYNSTTYPSAGYARFDGTWDVQGAVVVRGTTGGYGSLKSEVVSSALSGASGSIAVSVPINCRIKAVQLRVDTAITSGDGATSWAAAFSGGSTTSITSGQGFAKNTKINSMLADIVTTGTTHIAITPNSGTFSGGVIRAIVYYDQISFTADAP